MTRNHDATNNEIVTEEEAIEYIESNEPVGTAELANYFDADVSHAVSELLDKGKINLSVDFEITLRQAEG